MTEKEIRSRKRVGTGSRVSRTFENEPATLHTRKRSKQWTTSRLTQLGSAFKGPNGLAAEPIRPLKKKILSRRRTVLENHGHLAYSVTFKRWAWDEKPLVADDIKQQIRDDVSIVLSHTSTPG